MVLRYQPIESALSRPPTAGRWEEAGRLEVREGADLRGLVLAFAALDRPPEAEAMEGLDGPGLFLPGDREPFSPLAVSIDGFGRRNDTPEAGAGASEVDEVIASCGTCVFALD